MSRWLVSTLAGMRLGNSGARADLFRAGLVSSPECRCGVDETRAHYWLSCGRYWRERDELQRTISWILQDHIFLSVRVLVGFGHHRKEVNSKVREAVLKFLQDTGRFKPQEGV